MKALIRVFPLFLAGLLFSVAAGVAKPGKPVATGAAKGGKAVVMQQGDVQWTKSPTMKGLSVAPLWGDPSKGAYGALKKVAAGTDFGWHTHSFDQKVVGIAGAFDFQIEGDAPKDVGWGSYVFVPAGVKHTAKCRTGAECLYFEEQPGKSDYIPAKAK
jgi:quercetin dioxygenase-like cupin family protein